MRTIIATTVVAVTLALAPAQAFAASPIPCEPPVVCGPTGPPLPEPAEVYWSQVRMAHLQWEWAVAAAASARPIRWADLARLRWIHPALVPLPCNAGMPSSALERMAVNALRLAAVRRGDGADRTARRYVGLAGDYARDAVRNLPARCMPETAP